MRIPLKIFVKLSDPATGAFELTSTIDVSFHGARLVTKNQWEANHEVLVQPIHGSLSSLGRVAHCEAGAKGSYVIGLELYPSTGDWTKSGKLSSKQ